MPEPTAADDGGHKRLIAQLQQMPKQPAPEVVTSVAAQAQTILLACLAFPAAAAVLYGISRLSLNPDPWQVGAVICLGILPTPLLIGLLMGLWSRVQRGKRVELARGMYYVRWVYEPEQWSKFCGQSRQRVRWLVPAMTAGIVGVGLVFAGMVHGEDGKLFFGSVFSHYGFCSGIAAAAGLTVGLFCQHLTNITSRLRRRKTAQSLIGPNGVYITGQFWPMATFGHRFLSARIVKEHPGHVRFLFSVKTNHGWTESTVLIPIPPGQQAVAEAVVDVLRRHSPA